MKARAVGGPSLRRGRRCYVWWQLGSWEPQAPLSIFLPKVFSDIGAIQSLKRLVSYSTNGTTSALAKRALRLLGEEVPRRILPCVASWKEAEVQTWLQQIGFSQYCENFRVETVGSHLPLYRKGASRRVAQTLGGVLSIGIPVPYRPQASCSKVAF